MIKKNHKFIKPTWQVKEKLEPYMPDLFAIISVAASMVAMIFLGQIFVLLLYALWLPRAYYKGQWIVKPTRAVILPALIIIYSISSTLWSAHYDLTLRASLQFFSIILCSLIISRVVRTNAFIKGTTLGMCLALIWIVISSGGIHTEAALTGSLGSKNQVGANAEIGFYCAMICLFMFKKYWQKIFIALPAMLLCIVCLFLSQSATSNISLLAMIFASLAAYILAKLSKQLRMLAFTATVILMSIIAVIGVSSKVDEAGLKATGKDITLTGRTVLWEEAIKIGMRNPLLGVGLGAFWVQGNPEAEAMWYKFFIFNRTGFHFHNLFINIFVEIGLIGVFLWGTMYLLVCVKSFRYLLKYGNNVGSIFYVGMSFMYLVRSITEVDTTGPYGVGPLLFFYIVFSVASRNKPKVNKPDLLAPAKPLILSRPPMKLRKYQHLQSQ